MSKRKQSKMKLMLDPISSHEYRVLAKVGKRKPEFLFKKQAGESVKRMSTYRVLYAGNIYNCWDRTVKPA
jgi:hypothetical protein